MTNLESLADQLIQTVLFSAHAGEGKRNEVVVILKALKNDTWNEALEEAAKGFDNLYWGIHSNQEAADAVRALKREKRGGE